MSTTSQTPVPPGHAVRIFFVVRANKGLYGYAYGPFRYDEERKCYVFEGRSFSIEEWETQGAELILKYYKYRCGVKVEIVKDETAAPVETPAPAPAPVAEVPDTEPSAPAPSLPVPGDVTAPEPVAETVVTDTPPAEPVKRTRRGAKTEPAAPSAE